MATLQAIRLLLQKLLDTQSIDEDWLEHLLDDNDLATALLDAAENEAQPAADLARAAEPADIDFALLRAALDPTLALTAPVHEDQKSNAVLSALTQGFERMAATLSRRIAEICDQCPTPPQSVAAFAALRGQPHPGAVHHPLGNRLTCRRYRLSATQNSAMSPPTT